MQADGIEPEMPPVELPHLFDRLMEIGPVEAAGMGQTAIGWPTLLAWQQMTAVRIASWEVRLLRRLSVEWLVESRRAEKPDCPPPWSVRSVSHRQAINRKLAALFGG